VRLVSCTCMRVRLVPCTCMRVRLVPCTCMRVRLVWKSICDPVNCLAVLFDHQLTFVMKIARTSTGYSVNLASSSSSFEDGSPCSFVQSVWLRDVPDSNFPNPAGAGFGRIYEFKSGRSRSRICEKSTSEIERVKWLLQQRTLWMTWVQFVCFLCTVFFMS